MGCHTMKNGKVFKIHSEHKKGNTNTPSHYVAIKSLTLVHFEITKHSSFTLYFTNSTIKAN